MKKKLLFAVPLLALMGFGLSLGLSSGNAIAAKAEGEETSIVSSEEASIEASEETEAAESGIVEADAIAKKWYDEAWEWLENKVVPILGGVSVASIVSALVAIATAITKYKGDLTNRKVINSQDGRVADLEKLVGVLQEKLAKQEEYENAMLEQFTITLSETSATMGQVANYAKSTAEMIVSQNAKIEQVEKMKDAIEATCDLTAKSLALSEVAVKSGIAEDAMKIVETLKGGNSDGRQG